MKKTLKFEADLLSVSKPYDFAVGDLIKNINPNCVHYKSTGEVVGIQRDGDIIYQVNNQGATFAPGDVLIKTADQLMKVFTHTAIPAYDLTTEGVIRECVIAKLNVDGKTILAKNRDRGYKAQIEIVHEIAFELCYQILVYIVLILNVFEKRQLVI